MGAKVIKKAVKSTLLVAQKQSKKIVFPLRQEEIFGSQIGTLDWITSTRFCTSTIFDAQTSDI